MHLTTKGIKGHDLDLELKRLNLLVGPNGSGKSTAADAIRMVALGYVPTLGKRPVDLAALMMGEQMAVELTLDSGATIRRTLRRTDTGYVAGAEASWMRQGKPTEISKAITKLFGDEEQDVAEMLDIRELLAATPNQRAARIEQLLAAGARKPEDIAKAVARLIVMRLAETTEDRMPEDFTQALPMVPDAQRAVLFEEQEMLLKKILEAGITGAVTWANEQKRAAAEGLKKKQAAEHELRKRAVEIPEPDEREIKRLEAERSKLTQELGAARQAWTSYAERAARIRTLKAQQAELARISEETEKSAADVEAVHGRQLKELQDKSEKVLEAMGALKMPPEEDEGQVRDLESQVLALTKKRDGIELISVPDTTKRERIAADLKARIELAELSEWNEVLKVAQDIEDAGTSKGVKTALAKPVKRLRELARKGLGLDVEDLKHEYDVARQAFQEALEAQDKANAARQLAEKRRIELAQEIDGKASSARALRDQIQRRRRNTLEEFEAKRAELLTSRQNLQRQQEVHHEALQAVRSEKASVDRRLASVNDQLRGAGELPSEPSKPEPIQGQLEEISQALSKLLSAKATHGEIHAILDQIEEAKAAAVVFSAIEWGLQRQREVEISTAGGPLMRFMTEFLKAAGRKETPFIRAGQGSCAIGWRTDDGREIQIQALSGGEWCLFAAALTTAVIYCRKSAVKILLVEAGETDARILGQLLSGVAKLAENGLLTAVVMSPRPPEKLDPAWCMYRIFEDQMATATAAA